MSPWRQPQTKSEEAMQLLCNLNDITDGASKGFYLPGGVSLFAVRHRLQIYLYRNSCPHLGIPLEWVEDRFLSEEGELIQCASHGALFTISDGHCVAGPCAGQALQPLHCEVHDQQVWFTPLSDN